MRTSATLRQPPHWFIRTAPWLALVGLAACGGGADPVPSFLVSEPPLTLAGPVAPVVAPPSTLSGTVAVGAPMTSGRLRVLDASGAVVASDMVVDADGRYADITLTGTGPYRIEACGYSGGNYQCMYSVAAAGGTAHVTPLTSAMVLLASGQTPASMMTGLASGLGATALADAQDRLRAGLAPLLTAAGLSGVIDFVSGALDAGSRTGYDRLLDSMGVTIGVDANAFVQIVPRMGSGNLYLEQGSATAGTLTVASSAAELPLAGLETLFRNMSLAIRSADACAHPSAGLAALMASNARLSMGGGEALAGPAQVAQGLCGLLGGGDGEPSYLGSRFVSPALGRCDFGGANPVCGVSFALQAPSGDVQSIAGGMAVTFESGSWKFKGDARAISIRASARVQRDRRIDGATPVDTYMRALAFEIEAVPGLACAKVAQRDSAGASTTLAYFKRHGSDPVDRLSAWRTQNSSESRSQDPTLGMTRTGDDSWLELPRGDAGDLAVRNFYRGGRSVTVSLFADADCSTAFNVEGVSQIEVDVDGVPPVWLALEGLPWPELAASAKTALISVTAAAGGSPGFDLAWTTPRSGIVVDELGFCTNRALCGNDEIGTGGKARVSPSARGGLIQLRVGSGGLAASGYKMLSLYGGTGDGIGVQSNFLSCPGTAAGQICSD